MNLLEIIEQVRAFLERSGHVSYRLLRRQFELDEEALQDRVSELVEVQGVATREEEALAWAGRSELPPPPLEREPGAYTPKHLADKILQSRSAVEGERKQVTVLFADVQGSTALAEQVGPEEWHALLDRFFQILTDGVHRFEGTVNQYTGDGVMALFGAPIAHEDHAQRACYASLYLRDELRRFADELRVERGLNFGTRVGLNSGEVVVGKIGDDLRMDYTAQGHTVHLAQRVEQLAPPEKVYLAGNTAGLVEGYFQLRSLGEAKLAGVSDPTELFELEKVGEHESRFDVSLARGLSNFVGRELEMARLEDALERARTAGKLHVVGLVADAGTGKSRLAYEFTKRCRARGIYVLTSGCRPHGKSIPLDLNMRSLRSSLGISESDSAEEARNKIAAQLSRRDPGLVEFIPLVMELLGVAEPGRGVALADPENRQREFLRYMERNVAVPRPDVVVTLAEDMHWIDAASQAVSLEILRLQQDLAYLTVTTHRPEYEPPWADWPSYEEIRLKPLTAEDTAKLLESLLGPEASRGALVERIQERAAGNPFFAEEIVQSLVESGILSGERGAYRLARSLDRIEVPDSVQAVLAARIDRLGEREKKILQAASIIGMQFPESVLEAVVQLPQAELAAGLSSLRSTSFIFELSLYPEAEYSFKHPLTQEVAYDSQLAAHRQAAHARVARVFERHHADKLDEKAALLAHHWDQAAQPLEAAGWYLRAGEWISRSDLTEALDSWRKVRLLAALEADSPEARRLAIAACRSLMAWGTNISPDELAETFEAGKALAEAAGDVRSQAELLARYGVLLSLGRTVEQALAYALEATPLAEQTQDSELIGRAAYAVAISERRLGRPRQALRTAERALARGPDPAEKESGHWGAAQSLQHTRAYCLAELGELQRALEEFSRLVEESREREDQWSVVPALIGRAETRLSLGDVAGAQADLHVAREAAEQGHYDAEARWAESVLGKVYLQQGAWAEAIATAEGYLSRNRYDEGASLAVIAEAHARVGERVDAVRIARAARDAVQRSGGIYRVPGVELAFARVLLESDGASREAEISAALTRAQDAAETMEARPFQAETAEEWSHLARLRGDEAAREQHLREAHRLYIEMGATRHAERVAQELDA